MITSRRATGWHGIAAAVRLNVLSEAEAVELLTSILTNDDPPDLDGAAASCAELGYLPLAIEQAGSYITGRR